MTPPQKLCAIAGRLQQAARDLMRMAAEMQGGAPIPAPEPDTTSLSATEIFMAVCAHFKLNPRRVEARPREAAHARTIQITTFLCHLFGVKRQEIQTFLKLKDGSFYGRNIARVHELMEINKDVEEAVHAVRERLKGMKG